MQSPAGSRKIARRKNLMRQKHLSLLLACLMLAGISACQTATPIQPSPDDSATIAATLTAKLKNDAQIKLRDNGGTFLYHLTDRFSVFLDDAKYPVNDLACKPDDIIDTISNGS